MYVYICQLDTFSNFGINSTWCMKTQESSKVTEIQFFNHLVFEKIS